MASFNTLVDTFTGTTFNTGLWDKTTFNGGTFSVTQNNNAAISAGAASSSGFNSISNYDLTGAAVVVENVSIAGAGTGGNTDSLILVYDFSNNRGYYWQIYDGGTLSTTWTDGATPVSAFSTTFNATTHRWLRIRESGGTVFWDYSADGASWTNAASHANGFAVTAMQSWISLTNNGVVTKVWTVDNFNSASITTTQTIQGKSRITKTVAQTIAGKARITAKTLQTILGRAKITATTTQTILGKARIQLPPTQQTITGKSRIRVTVPRTILGRARIRVTVLRTILGRSRITKVVPGTITGKASIVYSLDTRTKPNIKGIIVGE